MEEEKDGAPAAASTTSKDVHGLLKRLGLTLSSIPRAMEEKDGAPAAASTTSKDVDGLLKRLEEMEARTKRLEDEVEEHREKLRESYDSLCTTKDALVAVQKARKGTVRALLLQEGRMDEEELACSHLLRLFVNNPRS